MIYDQKLAATARSEIKKQTNGQIIALFAPRPPNYNHISTIIDSSVKTCFKQIRINSQSLAAVQAGVLLWLKKDRRKNFGGHHVHLYVGHPVHLHVRHHAMSFQRSVRLTYTD